MKSYKIIVFSSALLVLVFSITIIGKLNTDKLNASVLSVEDSCFDHANTWIENFSYCFHVGGESLQAKISITQE